MLAMNIESLILSIPKTKLPDLHPVPISILSMNVYSGDRKHLAWSSRAKRVMWLLWELCINVSGFGSISTVTFFGCIAQYRKGVRTTVYPRNITKIS